MEVCGFIGETRESIEEAFKMKMICCEAEQFYHDFFPLIIELDCGDKFCEENPQHVEWMKKRIHNSLLDYGTILAAYCDDDGFIK